MKNFKTKLFAAAMAAPLALSGISVFADGDETTATPEPGSALKVKKTLTTATGVNKPTEDYTFSGDLTSVNGNTDDKVGGQLSATVESNKFEASHENGVSTYTATEEITIPTYSHAGVYEYSFSETPGSTAGMTYAVNAYKVQVYVIADGEEFTVDKIFASKSGENDSTVKVNPDKNGVITLDFENKYEDTTPDEEVQGIRVTNTVTGKYGDKAKQFKYTLTINPTATVKKDGNIIEAKNEKFEFTLADGESVEISGVPVGTAYTLVQSDGDEYSTTLGYTAEDKGTKVETPEYIPTQNNETRTTTGYVSQYTDVISYTNTMNDNHVIPTGNIINNLPFLGLIAVALGGFVAFIALKRRQNA